MQAWEKCTRLRQWFLRRSISSVISVVGEKGKWEKDAPHYIFIGFARPDTRWIAAGVVDYRIETD
jgi:hypothetical protein